MRIRPVFSFYPPTSPTLRGDSPVAPFWVDRISIDAQVVLPVDEVREPPLLYPVDRIAMI